MSGTPSVIHRKWLQATLLVGVAVAVVVLARTSMQAQRPGGEAAEPPGPPASGWEIARRGPPTEGDRVQTQQRALRRIGGQILDQRREVQRLAALLPPDLGVAQDPEDDLAVQRLVTRQARASLDYARLNREIAELAVQEYDEGTYRDDVELARQQLQDAEAQAKWGHDRVVWAKRNLTKGYILKKQLAEETERSTLLDRQRDRAKAELNRIEHETKAEQHARLQRQIDAARAEELDNQALWELDQAREAILERAAREHRRSADRDRAGPPADAGTTIDGQLLALLGEAQQLITRARAWRTRVLDQAPAAGGAGSAPVTGRDLEAQRHATRKAFLIFQNAARARQEADEALQRYAETLPRKRAPLAPNRTDLLARAREYKELQRAVESARYDELAKQVAWLLEQREQARLEKALSSPTAPARDQPGPDRGPDPFRAARALERIDSAFRLEEAAAARLDAARNLLREARAVQDELRIAELRSVPAKRTPSP